MDFISEFLEEKKCLQVKIELINDFPMTLIDKNLNIPKKRRKTSLKLIMHPEDLSPFADTIQEAVSNSQTKFSTHCRILTGDSYHWFFFSGKATKEKSNKFSTIYGSLIDVTEYLENNGQDLVMAEYLDRNNQKTAILTESNSILLDMLGKEYLSDIQKVFNLTPNLKSAIFDSDGVLICTPQINQKEFVLKDYSFTKGTNIRVNHLTIASWVIASNTEKAVENNSAILDMLAKTLAKIANAFLVLTDEKENSQKTNKLIGDNIEQQILLNNLYTIILEEPNPTKVMEQAFALIGQHLKLDRICIYENDKTNKNFIRTYLWCSEAQYNFTDKIVSYEEFPDLENELGFYNINFNNCPSKKMSEKGIKAYAIAELTENGDAKGVIFYDHVKRSETWSLSEKKIIKSITQILATILIRCNMDKKIKEKNKELEKLAFHDTILGIYNRAKLDLDLNNKLIEKKGGLALAIKITNMRYINEIFGHGYADTLFRKIAKFITELPVENKNLYRFSGSTLMLLVDKNDIEYAREVASKIILRFKQPWIQDNFEHYLEIGIGIALFPQNGNICEEIYRTATLAMYRSIEYAKNEYSFYTKELLNPVKTDYYMEQRLRDAISNNMNGFEITFQPVFSATDNSLAYCETLVRWNDEELGIVPTKKFIKLAENMGLDIMIDRWVAPKACEFCKKVIKEGNFPNFKVSINMTMHELKKNISAQLIADVLLETGLPAKHLIVELPEKAQIRSYSETTQTIGRLKRLGVFITLDSFGREYMSLNALKSGNIDMIKINQTHFSTNDDDFSLTLMNTIVYLAHSRDIKICVKKVEHKEMLNILNNFDVDFYQGNYFSPAYTEKDFLGADFIVDNEKIEALL